MATNVRRRMALPPCFRVVVGDRDGHTVELFMRAIDEPAARVAALHHAIGWGDGSRNYIVSSEPAAPVNGGAR